MLRKLDLHHLLFLHFHLYPLSLLPAPCHTRNLSLLLSALSLSLSLFLCLTRRFFSAVRPIPRIFAYFIIYDTMRPRGRESGEFCEFQHAEETYLEECYDLRANEVDSFAFLFSSLSLSLSPSFRSFFFFLIIPFNSHPPVTLISRFLLHPLRPYYSPCIRFASSGGTVARGKSLPLGGKKFVHSRNRCLIDAYVDVKKKKKKKKGRKKEKVRWIVDVEPAREINYPARFKRCCRYPPWIK